MSTPIDEGMSRSETSNEAYTLIGNEPGDVNSTSSSLSTSVTSEEFARQIKAAADPMTERLERLCDSMR